MQQPLKHLITVLTLVCFVGQAAAEDSIWYQVNVILFKPVKTDLDSESWPEFEPYYPADVTAITPPRAFRLSQIEQAAASISLPTEDNQPETEPAFAFTSRSKSETNRLIIEAVTRPENAPGDPGNGTTPDLQDDAGEASGEPTDAINSKDAIINEFVLPEPNPNAPGRLAFSRVDDDSSLLSTLSSLRRSSRYQILGSYAWLQPIDAESTPVMMQAGSRFNDRYELEGTLAFSRSRFLHVSADLWYSTFEPRGGQANLYETEIESTLDTALLSEYRDLVDVERQRGSYIPARTHRMAQSRRMRSSETHYLDHPLFGIIVRIDEFELPQADEE